MSYLEHLGQDLRLFYLGLPSITNIPRTERNTRLPIVNLNISETTSWYQQWATHNLPLSNPSNTGTLLGAITRGIIQTLGTNNLPEVSISETQLSSPAEASTFLWSKKINFDRTFLESLSQFDPNSLTRFYLPGFEFVCTPSEMAFIMGAHEAYHILSPRQDLNDQTTIARYIAQKHEYDAWNHTLNLAYQNNFSNQAICSLNELIRLANNTRRELGYN